MVHFSVCSADKAHTGAVRAAGFRQVSVGLSHTHMHAQDPKKRATANEILQHSWMRENGTASDRPLDNVIVKRMQGFLHMNKLKKEALKVMAAGMSPEEIAGLRSLFQVSLQLQSYLSRLQGSLHTEQLQ